MKIALIDPSLFTWPYDKALADGLSQNNNDVILYGKHIAQDESGKGDPLLEEHFYAGFQTRWMKRLPTGFFLACKGASHILSLLSLWWKLKKDKPDAIHFQWVPLPIIDSFFIPYFRRIAPTFLTVHDSAPFNNNPRSRLQRLNAISIMQKFDGVIVHTEHARQRLINYGLAPDYVKRIPHGLLEQRGEPAAPLITPEAMDKMVTLLLFGKLKPYKGADVLLNALGLLPPSLRAQCRLHIVGKPYMDTAPLLALIRKHGLEKNIVWDLRFVDDREMNEIFAKADIIVMPYREIDASGVLMVGLQTARPIVASRIGLFAEMLTDGKHGYLVPPDEIEPLADALGKLIASKSRREEMGQNVANLCKEIPTWNAIARMTLDAYAGSSSPHE